MKKLIILVFLVIIFLSPTSCLARDGYDTFNGDFIEIDKPNKLKVGRYADYYDYNAGEYKSGTVDALKVEKNKIKLEIFDDQDGTDRSFELDKR